MSQISIPGYWWAWGHSSPSPLPQVPCPPGTSCSPMFLRLPCLMSLFLPWPNPLHLSNLSYPISLWISSSVYVLNRAERKLVISEKRSEVANVQGRTRWGRIKRQEQDAHNKDSLKIITIIVHPIGIYWLSAHCGCKLLGILMSDRPSFLLALWWHPLAKLNVIFKKKEQHTDELICKYLTSSSSHKFGNK